MMKIYRKSERERDWETDGRRDQGEDEGRKVAE